MSKRNPRNQANDFEKKASTPKCQNRIKTFQKSSVPRNKKRKKRNTSFEFIAESI